MKTFTVLIGIPRVPGKKKQPAPYDTIKVEATTAHAAGWQLVQQHGVDNRAIIAIAEPEGPFLPWAGHIKNVEPKDPTSRRWACMCSYLKSGERVEVNFEICERNKEFAAAYLDRLKLHQPPNIEAQFSPAIRYVHAYS